MEMNEKDLLFAKVREEAIIPSKEDENAGYDIYPCFEEDFMVILEHTSVLVPTGIASAFDKKYYIQIEERGSTGSKGMKKSAGVIDSSYRGEWFVCISNVNDLPIIISKLSLDELINKHGEMDDDGDIKLTYGKDEFDYIYLKIKGYVVPYNCLIYPYSKAIAQAIVHEVEVMNTKEIPYEDLLKIPSKRGVGALGSSGK